MDNAASSESFDIFYYKNDVQSHPPAPLVASAPGVHQQSGPTLGSNIWQSVAAQLGAPQSHLLVSLNLPSHVSKHNLSSCLSRLQAADSENLPAANSCVPVANARCAPCLTMDLCSVDASYLLLMQPVKVFALRSFVRHEPLAFAETEQICRPSCSSFFSLFVFFLFLLHKALFFFH